MGVLIGVIVVLLLGKVLLSWAGLADLHVMPTALHGPELWVPVAIHASTYAVMAVATLVVLTTAWRPAAWQPGRASTALRAVWARRHHLSALGIMPRFARRGSRATRRAWRRQAWAVWAWVLVAYLVATVGRVLLASPTGQDPATGQAALAQALLAVPMSITTGWIEEGLVVAGIGILLLSTGREWAWPVALVAAPVIKVAYHLHAGVEVVPVVIPAVVCMWLWRRTHRLTPIMLAHISHNLLFTAPVLVTALVEGV